MMWIGEGRLTSLTYRFLVAGTAFRIVFCVPSWSLFLSSLFKSHYRCVTCGSDLEQKVNGVISYIPMGNPNTSLVLEKDGPQEA